MDWPATIILRHRRENLHKCSLRGLEKRSDMRFYTYPTAQLPPLTDYLLLDLEAPLLTKADAGFGLILLDATWRYAARMTQFVTQSIPFVKRALPPQFCTAYPRRQEDCPDPARGLASIEALYIAYALLGRSCAGLLDSYYWKERFLEKNQQFLDI